MYAYDGADPTFDLQSAKQHGGLVCSVYIVGTPGGMAHADAARVKAIRAAGMGVLANWERAANFFATCTVAEARQAGVEASAAMAAMGFPMDGKVGCAFSFDFDVPPGRFAEMTQKLAAVQAGLGKGYRAIGYAQSELIEYWAAHGQPGPHWLMMSTFGRPYLTDSPHVFMWQQVGQSQVHNTDRSVITQPGKIPAWWPDGSPYGASVPATPVPAPVSDMPTTGEWATRWTNPDTGVKRSAADWMTRQVNLLRQIRDDVAAIRKHLGA